MINKKEIFLVFGFLFLFLACNPPSNIPNGDFSKWKNEKKPENWILKCGERTTDAKEGKYAIRIQACEFGGSQEPGVAFSGHINVWSFLSNLLKKSNNMLDHSLEGYPLTLNPKVLKGHYKYYTEKNDTAVVFGWIEKEIDGENVEIATIGGLITDTTSVYKPFRFGFKYEEKYKTYDASGGKLWLSFSSTQGYKRDSLSKSTLYLDDVKIE